MAPSWGGPGAPSNSPRGAELAHLELLSWCSMAGGAQACPGSRVGPRQVKKLQTPTGMVWLAGPRKPYWDCTRCGSKGIYANRLFCNVCNHGAPINVRKVAQQQPSSPGRKGGGDEGKQKRPPLPRRRRSGGDDGSKSKAPPPPRRQPPRDPLAASKAEGECERLRNELKGLKEAKAKDKGPCAGGGSERAAPSAGRATRWASLEHGSGWQRPAPGK